MTSNWGGNIQGIRVPAQQDEYFQFLIAEHVEWLGISIAIFEDSLSDPTVRVEYRSATDTSNAVYTFDDGDLQGLIARAKQLGFKIYLTLAFQQHGDSDSSVAPTGTCETDQYIPARAWFGNPVPSDPCIASTYWWWSPSHRDYAKNIGIFWNSYSQVAVKYGALAQQAGVEMYSLGTETPSLFRSRPGTQPFTNDFNSQLTRMVAAVRGVYRGLLTYDEAFDVLVHPQDFGGSIPHAYLFSDVGLDVVGISAYFQLATSAPTAVLPVDQLESAWESIFQNYLIPLQSANAGRPIVFLEFGYVDDVGAPANPASNAGASEPPPNPSGFTNGMQQQQNIYQAFFNVDDRHGDLVRGAFLWGNEMFEEPYGSWWCSHIYFNLHCKPLATTVSDIYARWQTISPSTSLDLNQHGLTGSWFKQVTSGQGVEVEVFPNPSSGTGSTFVSWFTYDTVIGGAERQRWYTAQGAVVTGQPNATLTIYRNTGGNFNGPPVTTAQPVGTATLSFSTCTSGQLSYTFTDGTGRAGTIPLTRLTKSVTCSTATPYPTNADFALSGNWFGGAATSGQGMTAEVNPNSGVFFSAWYTYTPNGTAAGAAGQRWYTTQGSVSPGMRSIPVTIYETTGGLFDAPTPPGQSTVPVGTGTMAFQSCSAATFSYNFTGGSSSGLSGTIPLSRVGPVPPGCTS